ncbi:MAG TPA: AbgT family transporter [Acetobacteraceae bacterium]|nr:AbgT family transporter [Acetobacteraceae bacterium]
MNSPIVLIMLAFLVTGLAYGRGARTLTILPQIMDAITKTYAALGGLIFLFLVISQFLVNFNYSNLATVATVRLADAVEHLNTGLLPLLLAFLVVTIVVFLIIPAAIAKRAILAPIFIPLFLMLNVAPDGTCRISRRRLADQRVDAADAIFRRDRRVRAALPDGRRRRHGRGDDAAVPCCPVSCMDRSDGSLVSARHTPRRVAQPHIAAATIIRRAA